MMMRPRYLAAMFGATLVMAGACGPSPVSPPTGGGDVTGQFSNRNSCLETLFTEDNTNRQYWVQVERECQAAADDPSLDSIRKRTYAMYNVGRAKIELARGAADFGQAQEYFRSANSIFEDLTEDDPNFNAARLEYAKAQAGLMNFDRAVVLLSPLESLSEFDRTQPDYILNIKAKLERAKTLKAKATQYAETNDAEMLEAITAFNTAWSDSAPMPSGVNDGYRYVRAEIRGQARSELIAAAHELAERNLSGAPYQQPAVSLARRALETAVGLVRAEVGSNAGSAAQSAELASLSNRLGESELLLAGFEGPTREADFRCASGVGLDSRLRAALSAFRTADTNATPVTLEKADAQAGIGCATQALASTDPQRRNERLSQLDDAREAFVNARNNDPRSESAKPERHLQLGRALKDLAILQRDIVVSRPGAENRLPANAIATLNEAIASYNKAIIPQEPNASSARRIYIAATNARTNLDIAEAYTELGENAQAYEYLVLASTGATPLAEAKLRLGRYHYELGKDAPQTAAGGGHRLDAPAPVQLDNASTYRDHVTLAYREFSSARDIAANPATADLQMQARALLYLSRVDTEFPDRGGNSNSNLNNAVNYAKEALALTDSNEIREQECLARIRRGNMGNEYYLTGSNQEAIDAEARCTNALQSPKSYLLQGMYRFRLHHYQRATQQLRNLQLAIIALEEGARLHDTNVGRKTREDEMIRNRIELLLGVTQVCTSQDIIGQRRIDAMDVEAARLAGRYLAKYDVARCARS